MYKMRVRRFLNVHGNTKSATLEYEVVTGNRRTVNFSPTDTLRQSQPEEKRLKSYVRVESTVHIRVFPNIVLCEFAYLIALDIHLL